VIGSIVEFAQRRASLLNPPAGTANINEMIARFGEGARPLADLYGQFDGEAMWGALLPGHKLFSIAECVELADSTSDAWEWIEEEKGGEHPMRLFLPFLATGKKTQIGALLDDRPHFARHVVEYDYETGLIRSWSSSLDQFLDALFSFSLDNIKPPGSLDIALGATSFTFSRSDLPYLSKWPELSFPTDDAFEVEVSSIW
jgi:hypothetical protein